MEKKRKKEGNFDYNFLLRCTPGGWLPQPLRFIGCIQTLSRIGVWQSKI